MNEIKIDGLGLNELLNNVVSFGDFIEDNKLQLEKIPNKDGVYAFWWIGEEAELMDLNLNITIKGKKHRKSENKKDTHKIYNTKWDITPAANGHICLYVGKSHDIASRVDDHLIPTRYLKWYEHAKNKDREPAYTDMLLKINTSCQLRAGIEHLYKNKNLDFINVLKEYIGFSYYTPVVTSKISMDELDAQKMKERFYLEDLAVGYLRPLFNLDSER